MATTFQVESISRLLGKDGAISAIYVPDVNRQASVALADLTRRGAHVTEVSIDNGSVSNIVGDFPHDSNLLVIDNPGVQQDILRELFAAGARPAAIVVSDLAEDPEKRRSKYALLTQAKYYFAGLSGGYSLWSGAKQPAEMAETTVAQLPHEIGALPLHGEGVALLDRAMAPDGEVLAVPVRSALQISGWAMIAQDAPPAKNVFACVRHEKSGLQEFVRLFREPRPDVSTHFGTDQLLMTGFRVDLSPLCRRMGVHQVTLVQSDGVSRYESKPLFRFELQLQEYELAARTGLANRYLFGCGLEIGALQKPLRVSEGCRVRYIDRMTLEHLLEHYPEMAKIPVQAPDIVDDGQQLHHIAEDSQDFVVANHFLEHCPDPIRSLQTILRVLKQGGILYMAIPDKRHTFDLCRPVTPYSALKSAYVTGQRSGVAELFYEWAHLVLGLPPQEAKKRTEQLIAEDYSIHYNVWATTDLVTFLLSARQDFQIPFELIAAVSSENETIVLLERTGGRLPI
jgi:SAM-dependent methyltransferase